MEEKIEKFSIEMDNHGVWIHGREGQSVFFTPLEALMVLDILKQEEAHLKKLAEESAPLPTKIKL